MKNSSAFESIQNIPGVLPEHPLKYFRDMNDVYWQQYQEHGGMFTFYYGNVDMSLGAQINYFRQRCHDIQMVPDKRDLYFAEDLERDRKAVSAMRKDQIEFALMRQDYSDTHKDASWKSFPDYLASTANECLSEARKSGVMTDHQAKVISFYLTNGETSDLRSLRWDFFERSKVFYGGIQLTVDDIRKLYPKPIEEAA